MRAAKQSFSGCLLALVMLAAGLAHAEPKPDAAAQQAEQKDVAEQLVPQVLGWFTHMGRNGRVAHVFTGITGEPRQLIVELDRPEIGAADRRAFLIWLARKYRLVASAYAAQAPAPSEGDAREVLEIIASSDAKDVIGRYKLVRENGAVRYEAIDVTAQAARHADARPYHGLHRASDAISPEQASAFEAAWAAIEPTVHWRDVGGGANTDEVKSLLSQALRAYGEGRCDASIDLSRKAETLLRSRGKTETTDMAATYNLQALCHRRMLRVADAERLYRSAIDIFDKAGASASLDLAVALDNLASLYTDHDRLPEAEQLRLRALAIFRAAGDVAKPRIATALQNLAVLHQRQGRNADALARYEEALAMAEQAFGGESRGVAIIADNLAGLHRVAGQLDKAGPLYERALAIFRKLQGDDHPDTALALQNRALLFAETGRHTEAERSLLEAIAINERLFGASHDSIAAALNSLVLLYIEQRRWSDALAPARLSASMTAEFSARGKTELPSEGGQRSSSFRRLVQVAHALGTDDPKLMDEAFLAAQRALNTDAALALSQLGARHAAGDSGLARLLRERQDLAGEYETANKQLIGAVARAPEQRVRADEQKLRSRLAEITERIAALDSTVAARFPAFTNLSRGSPLAIAEVQALLRPNEVLLQYLDVQPINAISGASYLWVVDAKSARWLRLDADSDTLARDVARLRCGLDATRWPSAAVPSCKDLLQRDEPGRWLPFDLAVAHRLYQGLLGRVEQHIAGKDLLVVPTGPLTTLPFSVLVTAAPGKALPDTLEGYRQAAWLGTRQPVTVLPSAGALQALRSFARQSTATRTYLGIGNPLLDGSADAAAGPDDPADMARRRQHCTTVTAQNGRRGRLLRSPTVARMLSGGIADLATIRSLPPLPETADELCDVAQTLGAPESDVLLGSRATESTLKAMSEEGRLARYRILHFATHGALSGQLAGTTEPGLILTPPSGPALDKPALERDDGYLSASEIAALKLDADWIVLSACNTAGAGRDAADALSGMARAFLYAGSRALLVSHWEVGSDAAVRLVTRAFAEMKAKPATGRAEAMRIAMHALIEKGPLTQSHPSQWAPFVVVGEGSPALDLGASAAPALRASTPAAKTNRKTKPRPPRQTPPTNWVDDFWR